MRKILVPIDLSESSEPLAREALALATRLGASVTLVHAYAPAVYPVLEGYVLPSAEGLAANEAAAARALAKIRARLHPGAVELHTRVVLGPTAEAIAELAAAEGFDFIVIATHKRRGLARLALGSVTERVLHRSTVPMMVVPVEHPAGGAASAGLDLEAMDFRRVLLTTDYSQAARTAIEPTCQIAKAYGARLDVLHVLERPPFLVREWEVEGPDGQPTGAYTAMRRLALSELDALLAELRGRGVDAHGRVEEGAPWRTIVRVAEEDKHDVVVIASQGKGAFERLAVGSVAERVARHAPCRVLVTPPPPAS